MKKRPPLQPGGAARPEQASRDDSSLRSKSWKCQTR